MALRILQIVGGMNRGGVETWLMHVLRHIDRQQYQLDFLVHTTEPCAYDEEVRALGSRIIPCPHPDRPWQYAQSLKKILRECGPYDIVHSHVHHYSGWVLRTAQQAGVPVRIAHSHSDTSQLEAVAPPARRVYYTITKYLIDKYATYGIAGTREAARALFGAGWHKDSRWRVINYGIDLSPFQAYVNAMETRQALQISPDALVVGHVGSFIDTKNHRFIVSIARELVQQEPKAHFLLVGDGPLRPQIEDAVQQVRLADHFTFAGIRGDVPQLMIGAMDVFLMPSVYEGLPIALIEAQAAGLLCFISETISEESIVIDTNVVRLSFQQSAKGWASTIAAAVPAGSERNLMKSLKAVEESRLNIASSCKALISLYDKYTAPALQQYPRS